MENTQERAILVDELVDLARALPANAGKVRASYRSHRDLKTVYLSFDRGK